MFLKVFFLLKRWVGMDHFRRTFKLYVISIHRQRKGKQVRGKFTRIEKKKIWDYNGE